jgi:hypothetical protein
MSELKLPPPKEKGKGARDGPRPLHRLEQRQDAAFGLGALKRRPYNSEDGALKGRRYT